MADDPISRLQFACSEVDRALGDGFAARPPELVCAVMQSAAIDFASLTISAGLQQIAQALMYEDEQPEQIMRIQGVVRP